VAELPLQIVVAKPALIEGSAFTETIWVAVLLQPLLVPVTV
jgi:hypothetical protein